MRKLLLFVVFVVMPPIGGAAESDRAGAYICVPDYSTGYSVGRSGKWEPTQFDVKGKKYLLRNKSGRWYWTDFGKEPDIRIDLCTPFNQEAFTACKNREDEATFNRKTLRFQVVRPYGYVVSDTTVKELERFPPYYEIGKCSPL